MSLDDLRQWADIISALGSTGILAVFTFLFVRGDIVSRKTMETIIAQVTEKVINKLDDIARRTEEPPKRSSRDTL